MPLNAPSRLRVRVRGITKREKYSGMKWALIILALLPGVARAAAPTPAQLEFFEQRIRPMLANEC